MSVNIILYNEVGEPVVYENVETITIPTDTEGVNAVFVLQENS